MMIGMPEGQVLAALAEPGPAAPYAAGKVPFDAATANGELEGAMLRQDWPNAEQILSRYPPDLRSSPSLLLVDALIARHRGEPRKAIELYERAIAASRQKAPIHVALGYTYLDINAIGAAELQFRLALAGRLQPELAARVRQTLGQILEKRNWIVSTDVSVSRDSNVNQGTDAHVIDVLGLPFQIDDAARRKPDIGITGTLGVERIIHLSRHKVLHFSVVGQYQHFRDDRYDDASTRFAAGPEFRTVGGTYSVSGTYGSRWYGGTHYSNDVGIVLGATRNIGTDRTLEISAQGTKYSDLASSARSGWIGSGQAVFSRYLPGDRFWRAGLDVRRANTESKVESSSAGRAFLGYYRTFPWALGGYGEVSYGVASYDEKAPLLDARRVDRNLLARLRVSKRDANIRGFFPYVGLSFSHEASTLSIYRFTRSQYEFGLTRTF